MDAASRQSPRQLLGTTLGPGYRLVALLDSEGLACAYRAWDHTGDRYVVVRVGRFSLSPEAFERLEWHSGQLFERSLPHSVPAIDRGIHDGQPYVVVPYLAGGTLRLRRPHDNGRPLLPHPALLHTWLPQIAAALDAIHEHGLVHGAVSPDTILFDAASQPWLADFRIAAVERMAYPSQASTSPTAGHCPDRVPYLCPQRILGLPASVASDQYALAAIVYDYLATVPPCGRGSPAEVAAAQASHQIQPLQRLSPSLPESLCSAVHRALAHNPRDRHATCTAFVSAALADIPQRATARKLQLICPACRTLVHIETEAAGRQGRCQACDAVIDVDSEIRWLALPDDRLANVPVAGAVQPAPSPRRRWMPAGIATLAAAAAALAIVAVWQTDHAPPAPTPVANDPAAPAPEPAPAVAVILATAAPEQATTPDEADEPPEPTAEAAPMPAIAAAKAPLADAAPAPAAPAPAPEPPEPDEPAALPARPGVHDIAIDRLKEEIDALHLARTELVADRAKQQAKLVEQQVILKNLEGEEIQNRRLAAQKLLIQQNLFIQQGLQPTPATLQQLAIVNGEIDLLEKRLTQIEVDRLAAKSSVASAAQELEEVTRNGENLRQNWIARLSPLERDATLDARIAALTAESAASPDFPECRLYRALLYILAGNVKGAREDLEFVDEAIVRGKEPLLGSTAIDFVYGSLMLGDGPAARRCLANAQKKTPNDPILQHIQALCEMAENDFTKAADLIRAALRATKRGTRRDRILLCSDAAWLFAAAPSDQVRNPKLAEDHAAEAIREKSGKAWQAWRAQAVLQADEGRWGDAERSLAEARKSAPLVLADEIDAQMQAIKARQPYRIARREK